MGVQESWQAFLEWAAERGLPLKNLADWLEERGIPSLPAFVVLLLALVLVAGFFLLPALAPAKATLLVTVKSIDGTPVIGANVFLASTSGAFPRQSVVTNNAGVAKFENVPVDEVRVTVQAADFTLPDKTLKLKPGVNALTPAEDPSFLAVPKLVQRVSLTVAIRGPGSAKVALFDSLTKEKVNEQEGAIVPFEVEPNKNYEVHVEAAGWRSETKFVNVTGLRDIPLDVSLVKNQEDRVGAVHVQVLDAPAPAGRPIPNATIELIENGTEKVFFTLKAGTDGWATQEQVKLGTVLRVQVKAPGYLPVSTNLTVQEAENRVTLALPRATAPTSMKVDLLVEDIDGNKVSGAIVRAWRSGERIAEALALDGSATLEVPTQAVLTITAYKQGFLPASRRLRPLEEPRTKLVLAPATPETASKVKVHVVNVESLDQAGASVTLTSAQREPLGLPEQVTGLDGLAEFRDVPIGATVVARAASEGRVTVSDPTNITKEGTPGENATLLTLTLLPGQGTLAFTVVDHFTRSNVEDALISAIDGNETCTTQKGACTLSVQEGARRFTVAAPGYEPLTTSEVPVRTNIVSKQTVELVSTSVAKGSQLVFLGFYDLRGRKVNALSPASTYQARYLIRNPGIDFTRASAHIRLGPQERAIAQEAAAITGWDAAGATAYAGLGYQPGATAGGGVAERGGSFVTIGGTPTPTITPTASPTARPTAQVITGRQLQIFGNATPVAGAATPVEGGEATPVPTLYSAKDLHQPGLKEYKWVEFEFPRFQGSREFSVQFTTRAVEAGKVELSHRTAYVTKAETVRDPVDAEAGVRKHEILAALNPPNAIEISFKGECIPSVCVQVWFEGALGKAASLFEASFGEEFQLKFKALTTEPGKPLEAVLGTNAGSLKLVEGVSGTDVAAATTSENEQRITLPTKANREGRAEGAFSLQAVRLSKSAVLQLQVNAGTGEEQRYSKTLSVRVVGQTPNLNVQVSPSQLKALVDNAVTVNVQDPLGQPVRDAHVTVGRDGDALGSFVEAAGQETAGNQTRSLAAGRYRVEGVKPQSSGFVEYTVEAEGFRTYRGRLPVVAEDFIEVQPKTVTFSVSGKEFEKQEVTVTNHLRSEATVTITVLKGSQPTLTTVDTDVATLRIKSNSAATFSVLAKVSDLVLDVAQKATTLRENVAGRIQVTARAGPQAEQTESVAFAVQTSFAQKGIDELWELSTQSVNLDVKPPAELIKSEKLVVKSNSPVPLLINVELPYYPLSAEPLSIIVPPNGQSDLQLTANIVPEFFFGQGCVMDERTLTGDAIVYASFQGIRSQKKVAITTMITSSDRCTPIGAKGVWLPTNAHFQFLSPVKVKRNVDGSNVVQLPNGDRALFNAPSTATALEATVPAQTVMEFSPQYLQFLGDGAILRFPAQITLALPAGTTLAGPVDQPRSVVFKNIEVQLPPGTQVTAGYALGGSQGALSQRTGDPAYYNPSGYAGNSAPGAVNYNWAQTPSQYGQPGTYGLHGSLSSQVAIIPPNAPILVRAHSPEIPDGKRVRLPVRATLLPPSGSLVIEAEGTNQKVVQLPTRERFAVPAEALTQGLGASASPQARQASSGTLSLQAEVRVRVPAESELVLPPAWVDKFREGEEAYAVKFPFPADLELPKGHYTTARLSDGRYLLVINREQFIELDSAPRIGRDVVSVQANQRIRFGPFKPDAEGGETLAFPAKLTLTLPSGTAALDGPDSRVLELPARGEIGEGENRLLVPYTATLKPKNRPTSLEIQPDQEFTVPIPWVPERAEGTYTLSMPIAGRIDMDPVSSSLTLAAGLAQTGFGGGAKIREEGGRIIVTELGAATAKAFTVEGGKLDGRVITLLPKSKVTVFVNPPRELLRQCSVDAFEFTLPFDAVFELPGDAILSDNNQVVELQTPRTLQVFKGAATQFTYRLPKLHKLQFSGGTVTPAGTPRRFGELTVATGEARPTGGVRFSASKGMKVRIDACVDNTAAEEQGLLVRLDEGASFNLPDPTTYEGITLPEEKAEGKGRVQAETPFLTGFKCSRVSSLSRAGAAQSLLNIPFSTDGIRFPKGSEDGKDSTVVPFYRIKDTAPLTTSAATVDVPPKSVVHFLPCDGTYATRTSNVVRFTGDAASSRLRPKEPDQIVELDNEHLDKEVVVPFYYEGAEPRVYMDYAFGEAAGKTLTLDEETAKKLKLMVGEGAGLQATDGTGLLRAVYLQVAELKYTVDQKNDRLETPLKAEISGVYGKEIRDFKVVVHVPDLMADRLFGCVAKETAARVTVPVRLYTDRARTNAYGTTDLSFIVKISKKGNCAGKALLTGEKLLSDFWVNYANDIDNEKTSGKMKLSYKGTGGQHYRYLALVNNRPEPVKVEIKGPLTCNTFYKPAGDTTDGKEVPPGSLVLASCYPEHPAESQTVEIIATGAKSGEQVKKRLDLFAYSPDSGLGDLYLSSPLGEVAPGQVGSIGLCSKFYCSFPQTVRVFDAFVKQMKSLMDQVGKDENSMKDYCTLLGRLSSGDQARASIERTIPVHILNTRVPSEELKKCSGQSVLGCLQDKLKEGFDKPLESEKTSVIKTKGAQDVGSATDIAGWSKEAIGCGTYTLTARIPQACTFSSAADFKKKAQLEIIVEQTAKCEEKLPNAGLLMSEDPELFIGREVVVGGPAFGQVLSSLLTGVTFGFGGKEKLPVGRYIEKANAFDEQNSRALRAALFGTENKPIALPAIPYEDEQQCDENKLPWIKAVQYGSPAVQGAACVASIIAIAAYGVGAPAAWRFCSALVSNLVGEVQVRAGEGTECQKRSQRIANAFISWIDAVYPGGAGQLASVGVRQLGTKLLVRGVSSAAFGLGFTWVANQFDHVQHPAEAYAIRRYAGIAPAALASAELPFLSTAAQLRQASALAADDPRVVSELVPLRTAITSAEQALDANHQVRGTIREYIFLTTKTTKTPEQLERIGALQLELDGVAARGGVPGAFTRGQLQNLLLSPAAQKQATADTILSGLEELETRQTQTLTAAREALDTTSAKAVRPRVGWLPSQIQASYLKRFAGAGIGPDDLIIDVAAGKIAVRKGVENAEQKAAALREVIAERPGTKALQTLKTMQETPGAKALWTEHLQKSPAAVGTRMTRLGSFTKGALKIAAPVAAAIALSLVFDLNLRSVRAELADNYLNHLVVFSQPLDVEVPSVREACTQKVTEAIAGARQPGEVGVCEPDSRRLLTSQSLSSLCAGKGTCLVLLRGGKIANVQGYVLLSRVSPRIPNSRSLFDSIFAPDAPLVSKRDLLQPEDVKVVTAATTDLRSLSSAETGAAPTYCNDILAWRNTMDCSSSTWGARKSVCDGYYRTVNSAWKECTRSRDAGVQSAQRTTAAQARQLYVQEYGALTATTGGR